MKKHFFSSISICDFFRYILFLVFLLSSGLLLAQDSISSRKSRHFGSRIEVDQLLQGILHTNDYLMGKNDVKMVMNSALTTRLKYALLLPSASEEAMVYKGAYQGLGLAFHSLNKKIGNPFSLFIYQGAEVARLMKNCSLNYEWCLGIAAGWHPYNELTNAENVVIGSKVTAYLNTDLYLSWRLSRLFDLNFGVSLSHFSNGNTKLPNKGLNLLGGRLSLAYYPNRAVKEEARPAPKPFKKHVSCDVVLYGAWKSSGVLYDGSPVLVNKASGVVGVNVNPMYNVNHWWNLGVSLDGIYDGSANTYIADVPVPLGEKAPLEEMLQRPEAYKQMALGMSVRTELVMPYFRINLGVGRNFFAAKGRLRNWYQVLALKIGLPHNCFLHIGYSLSDFHYPNNLMLGIGYTFHHLRRK